VLREDFGVFSGGGARRLALPPALEFQALGLETWHFNRAPFRLRKRAGVGCGTTLSLTTASLW
jgi:hypothetical protein